jgi:diacylglycerol kinase family enzyme
MKSIEIVWQCLVDVFALQEMVPSIVFAHSRRDLLALARRAVHERSRILVAGGGDGTLHAVSAVLVGTDVVLAIVPPGTHNHFAKDVGIPLDIASAMQTILKGRVVRVDVGDINGHIFLNSSGLGRSGRAD